MAAVTYSQIRTWHFRETLATWLKGLDKAVLVLTAAVGPGAVALVLLSLLAAADAMIALSTASTPFSYKLLIVCLWQALTLGMLWALREALFMPRAVAFFSALPVRPAQQLRADVALCALCYSLLWLAAAWAIGRGFLEGGSLRGVQVLLTVAAFITFSLTSNLLLLRLGPRAAPQVALGALAFTLPVIPLIHAACVLLAVALIGASLRRTYQRQRAVGAGQGSRSTLMERIALRTGLALHLLGNELRAALLLRVSVVFGSLALVPLLAIFKRDAGLEAAGFIAVVAAAATAFYDLPALSRRVAFTKMRFLAGNRHFVRRLTVTSHAIQVALYLGACLAAGGLTMVMHDPAHGATTHLLVPSWFFAALFVAGTVAANLEVASARWLMPVVSFVAAVLMSGFV